MVIIVFGILVLIYISLPLPLQLIIFIANLFMPDPIPILDEVIMIVSILKKLVTFFEIFELFENHPILGTIILGVIVCLIISGIIAFGKFIISMILTFM